MEPRKNKRPESFYMNVICVDSRKEAEASRPTNPINPDGPVLIMVTGNAKEIWLYQPHKRLQSVISRDDNKTRNFNSENLFSFLEKNKNPFDSDFSDSYVREKKYFNKLLKTFTGNEYFNPVFWEVFCNVMNALSSKPDWAILPESKKEIKSIAEELLLICNDHYLDGVAKEDTILMLSTCKDTEEVNAFFRKLNDIILDNKDKFYPELYARIIQHVIQQNPENDSSLNQANMATDIIEALITFPDISLDCATALHLSKTGHGATAIENLIEGLKNNQADEEGVRKILMMPEIQKAFFILNTAERNSIISLLKKYSFNDISSIFEETAKEKPKIAVSYSPEVGGLTIPPISATLLETGAMPQYVDYRKIMPNDFFSNPVNLESAFAHAKSMAEDMLAGMDALLIPGNNAMVQPELYGESPSPDMHTDLGRAIAEMAMIHVALQKGMPILGICGGHQILNVYLGGKLANLTEAEQSTQSHGDYGNVIFDPSSELGQTIIRGGIPRSDSEVIQSFFGAHLQKVKDSGGKNYIASGDYLKVVATSDEKNNDNRSIEAVESMTGAPVKGLQFHPEIGSKGFIPNKETLTESRGDNIAKTEEAIKINIRMIAEFKQSALTYHQKREVMSKISNTPTSPGKTDDEKPFEPGLLRRICG